jgi:hypothetical protein
MNLSSLATFFPLKLDELLVSLELTMMIDYSSKDLSMVFSTSFKLKIPVAYSMFRKTPSFHHHSLTPGSKKEMTQVKETSISRKKVCKDTYCIYARLTVYRVLKPQSD